MMNRLVCIWHVTANRRLQSSVTLDGARRHHANRVKPNQQFSWLHGSGRPARPRILVIPASDRRDLTERTRLAGRHRTDGRVMTSYRALSNPFTGEHIVFTETAETTGGEFTVNLATPAMIVKRSSWPGR
ncbi:MAG TPA: hypothetical protein VGI66_06085 [Streptosporangiaceae bacterium]